MSFVEFPVLVKLGRTSCYYATRKFLFYFYFTEIPVLRKEWVWVGGEEYYGL